MIVFSFLVMATADNQIPQRRLSTGEVAASYPPGGVPSTPMEFRQGPHPKKVRTA